MTGATLKTMRTDLAIRSLLLIVLCGWSAVNGEEQNDRVPLLTMVPTYPELARRERVEGEVQVCFTVDRAGNTHRVRVRRSTNRIFEKPSILAARASTYEPLPEDKPVPVIKTCRTFRYLLNPVAIEKPS